jgi:hypothetical protein
MRNTGQAYSKHAEVTMPSLDDWKKDWQENPQRNVQPKLLLVDSPPTLTAIEAGKLKLINVFLKPLGHKP